MKRDIKMTLRSESIGSFGSIKWKHFTIADANDKERYIEVDVAKGMSGWYVDITLWHDDPEGGLSIHGHDSIDQREMPSISATDALKRLSLRVRRKLLDFDRDSTHYVRVTYVELLNELDLFLARWY